MVKSPRAVGVCLGNWTAFMPIGAGYFSTQLVVQTRLGLPPKINRQVLE